MSDEKCPYSGWCSEDSLCDVHHWERELATIKSAAAGSDADRWEMALTYLAQIAKHVPPSAEQIAYQMHPRIQNERLR